MADDPLKKSSARLRVSCTQGRSRGTATATGQREGLRTFHSRRIASEARILRHGRQFVGLSQTQLISGINNRSIDELELERVTLVW